MAGLKGITVNTAPEAEPHIYAEDDAAVFQTMFGEDGVSSIGQACKATVLSNNKVRVADGVICVGGHFARIPYGEYEDCEIANGQSGKNRNDIIVARFETTGTGGIDTYTCEVKQGTPGDAATDPELTQDNLYNGGKVRELPLYRVKIEGISIVAVEQMFDVVPTNAELIKTVTELNGNYANNVRFIFFTMTPYGSGNSSALITTIAKINSLFGITDATPQNSGAVIMNGDGNADSLHAEGVTWQGENLYAVFNKNVNGRFRITGLFYYSPAGAITLS